MGCSPWGREESDTTEQRHFHALEKEMATHSSVLAWRIPGMGEPGRLPSVGLQSRTRLKRLSSIVHHWRRQWHPTPVLLPGKSHGQRSVVGYSTRGHRESDTTERLHFHFHFSSSLLSAIRVVASAYLRLLLFLPAILIPVCASSSLAFCIMYSAYKLNKLP